MPDHAHLLLQGETQSANLKSLILSWNTRTGYEWRQRVGSRLWQEGVFDRVLRDDDDPMDVARYILMNPVEAGMVEKPEDYPLSGSGVLTIAEIMAASEPWKPWW